MCEFVLRNKVSLAFIIETWLQSFIAVSIIDIPGYLVLRKIRYKQLDALSCCLDHEAL